MRAIDLRPTPFAVLLVLTLLTAPLGRAAEADAPLTNAEVVRMVEVGLGDSVVVAKIEQAPAVAFDLETDDLVVLKEAGVSDAVLTAMLERATDRPPERSHGGRGAPAGPGTDMVATPMGPMAMPGAGSGPRDIWLETDDGEVALTGIVGEMSWTNAYLVRFLFLNFPGLDSEVRIDDSNPTVYLVTDRNPLGRFWVVTLDRDKDDNVRSVKMGSGGPFGGKMSNTPDTDWTVPFTSADEGGGVWSLELKKELKPGEYGVLVRSSQELYDFAVEP